MRKAIYALLGTIAGLGGLLGLKANLAPADTTAQAAAPPPAAAVEPSADAAKQPAGQTAGQPAKTATGKESTNPYESVQVKVTVSGKKITKVEIAKFAPKDAQSKSIGGGALPKLQQATLAANSADVDTVSGATFTTKSYKESLQSALDQAGL
ncbi:FMN-binding protein [Cryptosporangium phraense]|uniref:FMN-binding protein n=1 Tax=Cryptosporangium phraense TaxID=2593070 RepID=UPI00197AEC23|nr:FMN-binding protein [Cryptosporangium phraense]